MHGLVTKQHQKSRENRTELARREWLGGELVEVGRGGLWEREGGVALGKEVFDCPSCDVSSWETNYLFS